MKVHHFDVDSSIFRYLSGEKSKESLLHIPVGKTFDCEAISIHVDSPINSETLSHFPHLKLILTRSVGIDHIDISLCKKRGISVYRIVDYGSFAIAEHALTLMLYGARRIGEAGRKVKEGKFSYEDLCGITLYGKKIGIIGSGRIGQEMIKLLKSFAATIYVYDLFQNEKIEKELGFTYADLPFLLKNCDAISLHAPLTAQSHYLIGSREIAQMKDGAILINTARGGLIDTRALIENIKKFSFVGLDVLEDEKSFDKNNPLLLFSNVLITPHIAFFTDATVKKIAEETEKNIERFKINDPYGRVV